MCDRGGMGGNRFLDKEQECESRKEECVKEEDRIREWDH